jgi:hypothetical protein
MTLAASDPTLSRAPKSVTPELKVSGCSILLFCRAQYLFRAMRKTCVAKNQPSVQIRADKAFAEVAWQTRRP